MMQASETQWSVEEQQIAKAALQVARKREAESLVQWVQEKADQVAQLSDLWQLNDFLSARRFDIDGKYDDRPEEILFVLARLTKEGWLTAQDLLGLEANKMAKVTALSRIL
ncbi:MAG: hypothetical protein ACFB5Z_00990 [Elainellaceae cyanobacterium]